MSFVSGMMSPGQLAAADRERAELTGYVDQLIAIVREMASDPDQPLDPTESVALLTTLLVRHLNGTCGQNLTSAAAIAAIAIDRLARTGEVTR